MKEAAPPLPDTEVLFFQPVIERNRWLIRLRWIYPFFILFFLLAFRRLTAEIPQFHLKLLLLFCLPIIVNFFVSIDFNKRSQKVSIHSDYRRMVMYASIQLDFDLLVIFINAFISGGLDSPLINLFFLYIILTPFLVDHRKAARNLITAILLLTASLVGSHADLDDALLQVTELLVMVMVIAFTFFIASFLSKNLQKNEDVLQKLLVHTHELSISDGLTGLYNQTYFFDALENETKKSQRHGLSHSLIMFDVDFFKNYNDNNGHLHGSAALKRIGELMKKIFRTSDVLAKYGGDEFVIVLPQTEKVGAYLAAERFREAVETEPFPGSQNQPQGMLTVSIGIASFPEHGKSKEEILEKADKALYMAKDMGKNRTIIYHDDLDDDGE